MSSYSAISSFISEEHLGNNDECKRKLSSAGLADAPRTYPPTQLEWSANQRSIPMALPAKFIDSENTSSSIDLPSIFLVSIQIWKCTVKLNHG